MSASSKPRRAPRRITPQYLENAALYYLQRYASSAENLRRVMLRKIKRSCQHHGDAPDDFAPLLDQLIERYARSGLLNDRAYAEGRAASLRRQGRSAGAIRQKLAAKGLDRQQIEAALHAADSEAGDDAELTAAITYARRKKLGAFRTAKAADPQRQAQKDLAAMARGGFSYDIAVRALKSDIDLDV